MAVPILSHLPVPDFRDLHFYYGLPARPGRQSPNAAMMKPRVEPYDAEAATMNRRTLLGALPILLGAAVGCDRSHKRIIGVAPKGTSSVFWQSVYAGVMAAGRDFDVDILWNGPSQETEFARQIQIVDSMINRRVDGIVLSPAESTALVGVVDRAAKAGIPVTIFDSGLDSDNYVTFVATDNLGAGKLAAKTLWEMLGGPGPIALMKHVPGSASTGNREIGFHEAVAETYTGIEIVAEQFCMSDRARALAVAEDFLTSHPALKGIFCSSEAGTVGAARALESRDMVGKIKLLGFDGSPVLQEGLASGAIDALIVQDPYKIGYIGVETIVQKLDGETPEKLIYSPARVITADDLKDPRVQSLLNPELRKSL